jgi:hypothetical protein
MRTFQDDTGRYWDAAVSEESYGVQRLIFAARQGNEMRSRELEVYSRADAEQWLLGLEVPELRELLASAVAWRPS